MQITLHDGETNDKGNKRSNRPPEDRHMAHPRDAHVGDTRETEGASRREILQRIQPHPHELQGEALQVPGGLHKERHRMPLQVQGLQPLLRTEDRGMPDTSGTHGTSIQQNLLPGMTPPIFSP